MNLDVLEIQHNKKNTKMRVDNTQKVSNNKSTHAIISIAINLN